MNRTHICQAYSDELLYFVAYFKTQARYFQMKLKDCHSRTTTTGQVAAILELYDADVESFPTYLACKNYTDQVSAQQAS